MATDLRAVELRAWAQELRRGARRVEAADDAITAAHGAGADSATLAPLRGHLRGMALVAACNAASVATALEMLADELAEQAARRTCRICGGVGSTLIGGIEVLCVCQRRAGMAVTDGDERTEPLTTAELETVRRTLAG